MCHTYAHVFNDDCDVSHNYCYLCRAATRRKIKPSTPGKKCHWTLSIPMEKQTQKVKRKENNDPMHVVTELISTANEDSLDCSICLSSYQPGETVSWSRLTDGCSHCFHHGCIVEWAMKGHTLCPICRTVFWSSDRKRSFQNQSNNDGVPAAESNANNVILDIQADTRTNVLSREEWKKKSTSRNNSKVERMQFCVLHGLVSPPSE